MKLLYLEDDVTLSSTITEFLEDQNFEIINLLILYLSSTFLLLLAFFYGYYHYHQEQSQSKYKEQMRADAKTIYSKLQESHNSYSEFYEHQGYLYLVREVTPYYMGVAYIVIEHQAPSIFADMDKSIVIILLVVLLVVIATSIVLVKLILKPLRESLNLLDRFIRDTTHELNTPVATILTNIELLNKLELDKKVQDDSETLIKVEDSAMKSKLIKLASEAFKKLGVRDYGRIDIKSNQAGECFLWKPT